VAWDHDAVTVQDIIAVLTANAAKAKAFVTRAARDPKLLKKLDAVAGRALKLTRAAETR
jgi:hypothetical protein